MFARMQEVALLTAVAGAAVFFIASDRVTTYTSGAVLRPEAAVEAADVAEAIDDEGLIDRVTERLEVDRARVEALDAAEGAEPGTIALTLMDKVDDVDATAKIIKTAAAEAEAALDVDLGTLTVAAPSTDTTPKFAVIPALLAALTMALLSTLAFALATKLRAGKSESSSTEADPAASLDLSAGTDLRTVEAPVAPLAVRTAPVDAETAFPTPTTPAPAATTMTGATPAEATTHSPAAEVAFADPASNVAFAGQAFADTGTQQVVTGDEYDHDSLVGHDTGHLDTGHLDTGHLDTGHLDTGHLDSAAVSDVADVDSAHAGLPQRTPGDSPAPAPRSSSASTPVPPSPRRLPLIDPVPSMPSADRHHVPAPEQAASPLAAIESSPGRVDLGNNTMGTTPVWPNGPTVLPELDQRTAEPQMTGDTVAELEAAIARSRQRLTDA